MNDVTILPAGMQQSSCLEEALEMTMKFSSNRTDTTEEGSSFEDEYTFEDANARSAHLRNTTATRLHKVRKLAAKSDPDFMPGIFNRRTMPPVVSPIASPRRKSISYDRTKAEAELALSFGQSFTFKEVDWNPRQSISRTSSTDTDFRGNSCWEDESAFDCGDTSVPAYIPLEDASVIPPSNSLSKCSKSTNSPIGARRSGEEFSLLVSSLDMDSYQAKVKNEQTKKDTISKGKSPKRKKVIKVSSKDFAAMGFGKDLSCVKVLVKEHRSSDQRGHRSLSSLLGEEGAQQSEDNRPRRSSSPRRRGSFGTVDKDKRRSISPRRRSLGTAKAKDDVERRIKSPHRVRGCGSEQSDSSSGGRRSAKDHSRRSRSPRRRSSMQGSGEADIDQKRCRSPRRVKVEGEREVQSSPCRSTSRPQTIDSSSRNRTTSPEKRRVVTSRRTKSPDKRRADTNSGHHVPGSSPPHHHEISRTISHRIRDICITPEQLALLRKAGLTITDKE